MRIGILTGGGDCPGLNAVIRAVVRKGVGAYNHQILGFRGGWQGVLAQEAEQLTLEATRGILHRGGTILGTSRTDPFEEVDGPARIKECFDIHRMDGLIVCGGNGTLAAASRLHDEEGIPIVGVPKTIDNDLAYTDFTFGFLTAVQTATEAVDRLHSTAESHSRVMVVEVMGRNAGWIATYAGIAGGADAILIPEYPFDIEEVCRHLKHRHGTGKNFSIVVVAEGAIPKPGTLDLPAYPKDSFGRDRLGGIGNVVGEEIERRIGIESRVTILGHVQRGGTPIAADRVLASMFGVAAIDLAHEGKWGMMAALRGREMHPVALTEAVGAPKLVDDNLFGVAEVFFG